MDRLGEAFARRSGGPGRHYGAAWRATKQTRPVTTTGRSETQTRKNPLKRPGRAPIAHVRHARVRARAFPQVADFRSTPISEVASSDFFDAL